MMQLKLEERQRNGFDCAPMVYHNEDLTPELTHIARQTRSWRRFILPELADRFRAAPLPLLAQTAEQKSENKDETMVHAHRATPLPPLVPRISMKRAQKDEVAECLESITKRLRFSEMVGGLQGGEQMARCRSGDSHERFSRSMCVKSRRESRGWRPRRAIRIWGLEMAAEGA
ncbi:hypothetical protein LTR49_006012 [Elasticomyces elasticus]|nr:hypothetical protein LTR49_006012 [Elasticomyces elasticus]